MLTDNKLNIHIENLKENGNLSVRAYHICESADLYYLYDIINFYNLKKTFKIIRNCGELTHIELTELVKKYQTEVLQDLVIEDEEDRDEEDRDEEDHKNYTNFLDIPNLNSKGFTLEKIINFCKLNEITNSKTLLDHYLYNSTLDISLIDFNGQIICDYSRDEDRQIKIQLTEISQSIIINDINNINKNEFTERLNQNQYKLDFISSEINTELNNLSVRSKNVLEKRNLNTDNNLQDIIWYAFTNNCVNNWENIGVKSSEEILKFFQKCKIITHRIFLLDLSTIQLLIKSFEYKYKGLHISNSDVQAIEIKNLNFINFIWKHNNVFFEEREVEIISEVSRNELTKRWGVTSERVRQISLKLDDKINKKLHEIWLKFNSHCHDDLNNIIENDIIDIRKISKYYESSINSNFIIRVLEIVSNSFCVIKENEFISKTHYTQKDYYSIIRGLYINPNTYISTNKILAINVKEELDNIIKQIFKKKKKILKLKISNINIIIKLLNTGISNQYSANIDSSGYLTVCKQDNVTFCYLSLKKIGKPSSFDEIFKQILIDERIHKKDLNKSSLRATMTSNKDMFFCIGKTGTYGLIEWNKTDKYAIKSIKKECIDILSKYNIPLHINQIFNKLNKKSISLNYRSVKSIVRDEKDIFGGENGFYILKSKKYDFEKSINAHTSIAIFKKVIKNYIPLKENVNNPLMHAKLNKLEMPEYQLDFLKDNYLNSITLNKTFSVEEEKIREIYLDGEPLLALQSFKKYFKTKHPTSSNNKIYEAFNILIG